MPKRGFYKDRNGYLEYNPTPQDITEANQIFDKRFSTSNRLNPRTVYDRKESRLAGILGEVVFQKFAGSGAQQSGEGDIVYDFVSNGKTIDVKCKFRKVYPQLDFEASFFLYQTGKHYSSVDYYVFMSTIPNYEKVWICGYIGKKACPDHPMGKIWRAGDIDPTNGKVFDADTWSVAYRYLKKF